MFPKIPLTKVKGFICECGSKEFNLVLEPGNTKMECKKCGKQTMINLK